MMYDVGEGRQDLSMKDEKQSDVLMRGKACPDLEFL